MRLTIRHLKSRGRWELDYRLNRQRHRPTFKTKALAEAQREAVEDQISKAGTAWIALTAAERNEAMTILSEAKAKGITLRSVWDAYQNGRLGVPMIRRSLKDAITDTIAERTKQGCDERYVTDLETFLERFAVGRSEDFIDVVTKADIESWLDNQGWKSNYTYNSNLGRIGSLFDVAFRNGHILRNPIELITPRTIARKIPERFSFNEARIVMWECSRRKSSLAYFALGLFAGLRPDELRKVTWDDIDLDAARLDLSGEKSKVKKPRFIPLEKACVEWLRVALPKKKSKLAPIAPPKDTLRNHRRALRKKLKGRWPQDVLRHTAASFLTQLHGSKEKVALWLGNSVRELDQHYLSPVTPEECANFWKLKPTKTLLHFAPKNSRAKA